MNSYNKNNTTRTLLSGPAVSLSEELLDGAKLTLIDYESMGIM